VRLFIGHDKALPHVPESGHAADNDCSCGCKGIAVRDARQLTGRMGSHPFLPRALILLCSVLYIVLCIVPPAAAQQPGIDSLLQELDAAANDSVRVEVLLLIAQSFAEKKDHGMAVEWAGKALLMARQAGLREREARAHLQLGFGMAGLRSYSASLQQYQRALLLLENTYRMRDIAMTQILLGQLCNAQYLYAQADEHYRRSLSICTMMNDVHGIWQSSDNLAKLHVRRGRYDEAKRLYESCAALTADTSAFTNQRTAQQKLSSSLSGLAWVAKLMGQSKEAIALYRRSLSISEELGDSASVSSLLVSLGQLYTELDEPRLAEQYVIRGLYMARRIGDPYHEIMCGRALGKLYHARGEHARAIDVLQPALQAAERMNDLKNERHCLRDMSDILSSEGRASEALKLQERILDIVRRLNDRYGEAVAYGNIAEIFSTQGSDSPALDSFRKALAIAEEIGDDGLVAMYHVSIGRSLLNQGAFSRAMIHFNASLEHSRQLNDLLLLADAQNFIGDALFRQNCHAEAMEYLQRAQSLFETAGSKRGVTQALARIGDIYLAAGRYEDALAQQKKVLALAMETNSGHMVAAAHQIIGVILSKLGEIAEAREHLQLALRMAEQLGRTSYVAHILGDIGETYSAQGAYASALPWLERSLALQEALGEHAKTALTLCSIARAHVGTGDDSTALHCYLRATECADSLHANSPLTEALRGLAALYARTGDTDNAYAILLRLAAHEDSIQTADERRKLAELMERQQAEQRERELDRLEQDKSLQSLEFSRREEAVRRQRSELRRNAQRVALLARDAELERLAHGLATARLRMADHASRQMQRDLEMLEKDRRMHSIRLGQESEFRAALITAAILLFLIGLLLFSRHHQRRRSAELQAQLAVTHARAAEQERLRMQGESARREKDAQRRFIRGLIDAQESERRRWAGELHDSLGQDLIVVKNQLLLTRETTPVNGTLDGSISEVDGMLVNVRRLTNDLYPNLLDRYGVASALRALIDRAGAGSPVRFTAEIADLDGTWSTDAQASLYRIVQEGVGNILAHAEAQHARIRLTKEEHALLLVMEDDGKGIPHGSRSGGPVEASWNDVGMGLRDIGLRDMGLRGMSARAEMLGGSMTITSSPGDGTNIRIQLPLTAG
jgi:signal transduction histidine kinase